MPKPRHASAAALALALAAVAVPASARIRVDVTADPGFSLGSYQTFDWYEEPSRSENHPLAPNSELSRMFRETVAKRLHAEGLRQHDVGEVPQLLVRWTAYVEDVLLSEDWEKERWAGPVDPARISTTRGVVIVELVDVNDTVVWSGRARSSAATQPELRRQARRMLEKIVARLE